MSEQFWIPERLAALRKLWDKGLSCAEIGKIFDKSANSVSSACRTYDLPRRRSERNVSPYRKLKARKKSVIQFVERPGWPTLDQLMAGR